MEAKLLSWVLWPSSKTVATESSSPHQNPQDVRETKEQYHFACKRRVAFPGTSSNSGFGRFSSHTEIRSTRQQPWCKHGGDLIAVAWSSPRCAKGFCTWKRPQDRSSATGPSEQAEKVTTASTRGCGILLKRTRYKVPARRATPFLSVLAINIPCSQAPSRNEPASWR